MRIRSVLLTAVALTPFAHAQGVWVTRSAAPTAREGAAVVVLGDGRVLLAGGKGSGGAALSTVELYEPLTDRFAAAPSLPLPEARPVGVLLRDGAVLLVRDSAVGTWVWRPGDAAWSPGPALPAPVPAPLLTRAADGAVLLASATSAVATWRLSDGAWKAGPTLARPNAEALLSLSDGALVAVVSPSGEALQTVLRLAPGATAFEGAAAGLRGGAVAVALPDGGLLLAGGGSADGGAASAETALLELITRSRASAGLLNEARSVAHATLLPDGRVLVAGGRAATGLAGTPELFTPDAGFAITASGETRLGHGQTLTAEGQVLLLGGRSEAGPLVSTSAFDVASPQWTLLPAPPGARLLACGALLPDGRFLLVGGESPSGVVTASAALFDPRSATWSAAPAPPAGLSRCTATLVWNGQVLVAGGKGLDGKPSSEAFLFRPAQNAWAPAGRLRVPREGARAVLARDGAVWVVGGLKAGRAPAGEVERWSPADNRFALKAPLPAPRQGASVTALPDGRVLVLGGATADGARLSDVDVLEPEKNTWSRDALPQPGAPRAGHTLTVLPDGSLLAWGGQGASDPLAERLAPGASAWAPWGRGGRARAGHTLLQLPGGALLAVGGAGEGRESAERVDGPSALPLEDEALPSAVAAPLVAPLLDGRVLVIGPTVAFWRSAPRPHRAPTLSAVAPARAGQAGEVTGEGFAPALGTGDGYPGAASANHPVLLLRSGEAGAALAALTTAFTEQGAQVRWPAVPAGHHRVQVSVSGASSTARIILFAQPCAGSADCAGGTCGAEGVCCDRPCPGGSCASGACDLPLAVPPGALTPRAATTACGAAFSLEVKAAGVAALSLVEGPPGMTLEGSTLRWAVPADFSGTAQARFFESEDVLDIAVTCAPAPPPPEKKGCGCAADLGPLSVAAALALLRGAPRRRSRPAAGSARLARSHGFGLARCGPSGLALGPARSGPRRFAALRGAAVPPGPWGRSDAAASAHPLGGATDSGPAPRVPPSPQAPSSAR